MATSPALPRTGDVVGGKYRIERRLGSGGMGVVYEATHRVTNKRFAIKWLLPEVAAGAGALRRFIREAQVAGRFEHPNVVEVYDLGQDGSSYFMVMELLAGESLAERLSRVGPLSPQHACEILVPCMEGVAAAHVAGIIHRDLKPANIFICAARGRAPETAKVLDFGISKLATTAVTDATLTQSGSVMGTPHYMAPEQMRAQPVDLRTDVYAFGVILYEALGGCRPFDGATYADLVLQVLREAPLPLQERAPHLPEALCEVVMRAIVRDPAARYRDLPAMVDALAPFWRPPSLQPAAAASMAPAASGAGDSERPRASDAETPLFSESVTSLRPIGARAYRTPIGLASTFAAALLGVFLAAVLSRPNTAERSEVELEDDVQPATEPPPPLDDPEPLTVRIEPASAAALAAAPEPVAAPDAGALGLVPAPPPEPKADPPVRPAPVAAPRAARPPHRPAPSRERASEHGAPPPRPAAEPAAEPAPGRQRVKLELSDFTIH